MRPLDDITVYYHGSKIPSLNIDVDFRYQANYICDFYHRMLGGYKPPKTSRICIHLNEELQWSKPNYCGSICSVTNTIDHGKFLTLQPSEQYSCILDIVHNSCLALANRYSWDEVVFQAAYEQIRKMNFQFTINYPAKKSKDGEMSAHIQIEKTERKSWLHLVFNGPTVTKKITVVEKQNRFCYDGVYKLANNSKWFDQATFGVYKKDINQFICYSLLKDALTKSVDFDEPFF